MTRSSSRRAEARLDALVTAAKPLGAPDELTRRRIWARLRRAPAAPPRRLAPRAVIAAILLASSGGAVGALGMRFAQHHADAPRPTVLPAARAERPTVAPRAPATSPPAADPEETPAPAIAARPRPIRHPAHTTPPREEPVEPEPTDAEREAGSLATIVKSLRADRDPRRALALLDEHEARWRTGELHDEAVALRVEAAATLGRHDDARAALERSEALVRSRPALWLIRAELRGEAGACVEAVRDYDQLRTRLPARSDEAARALIGEASCRERLGDRDAARGLYLEYLRRFPDGRFAGRARAAAER